MATSPPSHLAEDGDQNSSFKKTYKKYDEIISKVPKLKVWGTELFFYQDFWIPSRFFKGVMLAQDHFKSKPEDVILASYPKCGTTWFSAIIFATINRSKYDFAKHPLLSVAPRDLRPFLDRDIDPLISISPILDLSSPRFLITHIPCTLFPKSVTTTSGSGKFVYVCRDPKDCFISMWHFCKQVASIELPLHDVFELFCQGISGYGAFWDHVLSYWRASLEAPDKVLFMKYEDMIREPLVHVKRLAEFLRKPFSMEEQNEGVVEEIIRLCSFEKLSNLDVNKSTTSSKKFLVQPRDLFRKGKIGDWKNYLTPEMATRLDQITQEKLRGSGLTFA